jgi:hypothetical protein
VLLGLLIESVIKYWNVHPMLEKARHVGKLEAYAGNVDEDMAEDGMMLRTAGGVGKWNGAVGR